jgi:hypothetical protein
MDNAINNILIIEQAGKKFAVPFLPVVDWDALEARVVALETKIVAELDGLDEVVTDIEAML